jgi:hypothetical protein
MRRVLIVAYYFPPVGGIGSIRLARFAHHLPEFGWQPRVLAPRATPHARDPELRYPEDGVVRSPSFELSRLARAIPGQAESGENRNGVSLREMVRSQGRRLVFPDAQIGWYPAAVLSGLRVLRRERIDAVYSSSFPITAHLVARTLSRRARLPWVAEFRDPWSEALPADFPHRRRAARLEGAIARGAAELVMPTPTWAADFAARWCRNVSVIPNGFDAPLDPAPPPDRPTITHLGTYTPGRQSLGPLWEAVARQARHAPQRSLRIRFIGSLPAAGRSELVAAGIDDLVEETGFVSHAKAMRLLVASSLLVASGSNDHDVVGKGWIPAKLFEYLATPLPILYLGDPGDDAAAMLMHYAGCRVADPHDPDALHEAVGTLFSGTTYARDASNLSRRARTRDLAALFDRAARPRM